MRVTSRWGLGKDGGGGLAPTAGDFGPTGTAFGIERPSPLIVEGFDPAGMRGVAGRGGEELFEGHHACRVLVSPLSFSNGVGHPQGYAFVFDANMKFSSWGEYCSWFPGFEMGLGFPRA